MNERVVDNVRHVIENWNMGHKTPYPLTWRQVNEITERIAEKFTREVFEYCFKEDDGSQR